MFLHYIMKEDEHSLISRFFKSQKKNPTKGDWYYKILEDFEELEIFLTLDQIRESSRFQFKSLVDKMVQEKAFAYLVDEKNRKEKGKVSHIKYETHCMQPYLKEKCISIQLKKFIFSLKCRMLNIASNYPNKL